MRCLKSSAILTKMVKFYLKVKNMNFENYKSLCAAIGKAQQAGHDVEPDWDALAASIQTLVGAFQNTSISNIHAILHDGEGLEILDTTQARDAVNELCDRYGVAHVCDPGETPRQTASNVAAQVVNLLSDP